MGKVITFTEEDVIFMQEQFEMLVEKISEQHEELERYRTENEPHSIKDYINLDEVNKILGKNDKITEEDEHNANSSDFEE